MRATRVRRRLAMIVATCLLWQIASLDARPRDSRARFVTMEVTVRDDIPPLRMAAKEGEAAVLENPDVGKFDFTPSFQPGDDAVMVVTIADASVSPHRRLAEVKVPSDGTQRVPSKTSPNFWIRIARIVQSQH